MTKAQVEQFTRRMETIWQRNLRRAHRHALDTIRQLDALKREYQLKEFASLARASKTKEPPVLRAKHLKRR